MVNLIRFAHGDAKQVEKYVYAIEPFLVRVGASVVHYGTETGMLAGDDPWDAIVISKYPSRAAVAALEDDAGYQSIANMRTRSNRSTTLQPTPSSWKRTG